MNAVDTNVIVYSIDSLELPKQVKAQRLLGKLAAAPGSTLMLWQVLGESIQCLRRWKDKGKLSDDAFRMYLEYFRTLFPVSLSTLDALDHAVELSQRYSLSHWDSMLLGACRAAQVTTLYTEDMGSPRTIDGIDLVNPFL
ncbi:MAG: PIN domain-containing protein [Planctomycetota bacterium]